MFVALTGCGRESQTDETVAQPAPKVESKEHHLSESEAKRLATDTLDYFNRYQKALADDAVMNKDALLRVFSGPEFQGILHRWPAPYTGDTEAEKYIACQNLLVSASVYAHAKHDFAFNGLAEKNVIPLRRQFRQDIKDCNAAIVS
ncbi:hypothetical protein DF121_16315 [Burkholderia stagnalis]|nr:hypothetical protein CJO66_13550 [Burkholderia ubonensis]RQQ00162.1 hypothetical protein DF009_01960 [Burkholderia ubonensis]RQY00045.1 hypothetical protein DF121_16315 [Burkholderia stagnalis]RQY29539.1 hypothetical protein DF114_19095 [Burkholderia stagnalis]